MSGSRKKLIKSALKKHIEERPSFDFVQAVYFLSGFTEDDLISGRELSEFFEYIDLCIGIRKVTN